MFDISRDAERTLRSQGLGDAEIDELRRTGRRDRPDADGGSMLLADAAQKDPGLRPWFATTGERFTGAPGSVELTPEALQKLRKYSRLIPPVALAQIEHGTGEDLDGDGEVGRVRGVRVPIDPVAGEAALAAVAAALPSDDPSSVMPSATAAGTTAATTTNTVEPGATQTPAGPFVQGSGSSGAVRWLLLLVALGLVAWVVLR